MKRIHANGIDFAYLEEGTGPLVVCVHGFPDTAHTWSDVLPRLAAAGFRAVAPMTRGIPPTSAPADGDYSLLALAEDVLALAAALGEEQPILVGHDWGAGAAYLAAALAPARVRKLVTVGIPHPRALRPSLRLLRSTTHFLFLQLPFAAGWVRRRDYAYLEGLYRKWSPAWRPTLDDLAPVKAAYTAGGLRPAIAYYRAAVRGALGARGRRARRLLLAPTAVPAQVFLGTGDPAYDQRVFDACAGGFSERFELVRVPGAGHFAHRESPDLFAERLLAFLQV